MVNNNNFFGQLFKARSGAHMGSWQGFIVVPKLPPAGDLVTKPIFHKETGKKRFLDSETFINSFVAHTK